MSWLWFLFAVFAHEDSGSWTWRDSTRDIYVNGVPTTAARFFYSSDFGGYALLLPDSDRLFLLKKEGDAYRLDSVPRKAFDIEPDLLTMSSASDFETKSSGKAREIDGKQLLFQCEGRTVLIARHEGRGGGIELAEVWQTVPTWLSLKNAYQPDQEAVEFLRVYARPTAVKVFFGTWCGDSKNFVPKLVKTLELADNPLLKLELTAIASGFTEPWEEVRNWKITNVPTVILLQEGEEIGRYVEHPQGSSIEGDLADMLDHSWMNRFGEEKEPFLLAEGHMNLRQESGDLAGTERWHLYRTEDQGFELFSQVFRNGATFEVRLTTAKDRRPSFLEVTERTDAYLRRARYFIENNGMTVTLRGSDTGVLRQTIGYSGSLILSTPSAVVNGFSRSAPLEAGTDVLTAHPLGASIRSVPPPTVTHEKVALSSGRFATVRQEWGRASWWLHPELGIPIKCEDGDGANGAQAEMRITTQKSEDGF